MIVELDVERFADVDQAARRGDVTSARGRVPGRMVVGEDERSRADLEAPADDLSRIDRRLPDRSVAKRLIGDEAVLGIQKEDSQALARQIGHADRQIIEQRLRIGEHRGTQFLRPQRVQHRLPDQAQMANGL